MAGVAEKARFYIERCVPQLREWEEKEIFTKDELRSIVRKRSDHEHRILAPVSRPADFTAYATWEQSLDALRRKRTARLKISHLTSQHASQARVLQIFARSVERHPGSGTLWRAYLDYAARVRAARRWRRVMIQALRMHPSDAELWAVAGRRAARNGDMQGARAFFMRGVRFCQGQALWIEYARCEMDWLVKMEARRRVKKGPIVVESEQADDEDRIRFDDDTEDEDGDGMVLPEPSAGWEKVLGDQAAELLAEKNLALDGAIPRAIFDICQKQSFFSAATAETFFDLFASFGGALSRAALSQHVLDAMTSSYPDDPATSSCYVRQPVLGVDPKTAEFPRALRAMLSRLREAGDTVADRDALAEKIVSWADGVLAVDGLDDAIRAVLEHAKKMAANGFA